MCSWLKVKSGLRRIGFLHGAYARVNLTVKNVFDIVSLGTRDVIDRAELRTRFAHGTRYFDSSESVVLAASRPQLHAEEDVSLRQLLSRTSVLDVPSVTRLENAEIIGNGGVVLTAAGDLVLESTFSTIHYYRRSWDSKNVLFHRRIRAENLAGPALCLVSPLSTNYFHWMVECLPRLFSLQALPEDRSASVQILINGDAFPFQKQSISALFGIEGSRIVPRGSLRTCVDELYIPTYRHHREDGPEATDLYSCRVFQQLRELHRNRFGTPRAEGCILLLRGRKATRQIENIEEFMKRFPFFRTVYAEDLRVEEQMNLFAAARVIAAVHGAGLTNLIFCSPGCRVIEFYPRGWDWQNALCTLPISAANGLDHHLLIVDAVRAGPGPSSENVRLSERDFRAVDEILEKAA